MAFRPTGNFLGIILISIAVLGSLTTSIVIKFFPQDVGIATLLGLRFVAAMPPLILLAWWIRGWDALRIERTDRMIFRMLIGHTAILFWFLSVRHLSLGQATALSQSSAIFVTALAPFVLGENVGARRWAAVIVGLIGVIFITNPFSEDLNWGILYGLGSAITGAWLAIILRILGKTEQPITVALWHNGAGAIGYPLGLALIVGTPTSITDLIQSPHGWVATVVIGLAAAIMQFGFTSAYRHGEAAVIVPIRYLAVPLATLVGWLGWGERPSVAEYIGMSLVIGSCLFIAMREYKIQSTNQTKTTNIQS